MEFMHLMSRNCPPVRAVFCGLSFLTGPHRSPLSAFRGQISQFLPQLVALAYVKVVYFILVALTKSSATPGNLVDFKSLYFLISHVDNQNVASNSMLIVDFANMLG